MPEEMISRILKESIGSEEYWDQESKRISDQLKKCLDTVEKLFSGIKREYVASSDGQKYALIYEIAEAQANALEDISSIAGLPKDLPMAEKEYIGSYEAGWKKLAKDAQRRCLDQGRAKVTEKVNKSETLEDAIFHPSELFSFKRIYDEVLSDPRLDDEGLKAVELLGDAMKKAVAASEAYVIDRDRKIIRVEEVFRISEIVEDYARRLMENHPRARIPFIEKDAVPYSEALENCSLEKLANTLIARGDWPVIEEGPDRFVVEKSVEEKGAYIDFIVERMHEKVRGARITLKAYDASGNAEGAERISEAYLRSIVSDIRGSIVRSDNKLVMTGWLNKSDKSELNPEIAEELGSREQAEKVVKALYDMMLVEADRPAKTPEEGSAEQKALKIIDRMIESNAIGSIKSKSVPGKRWFSNDKKSGRDEAWYLFGEMKASIEENSWMFSEKDRNINYFMKSFNVPQTTRPDDVEAFM